MGLKLYMVEPNLHVRATMMTAKAIGVNLELIPVDLKKGENLKPEYLKLNPQHSVPMLEDNGFVVWDSHAVNVYLVSKHGKDDSLYPKDFQKQATINQRLHFDSSVVLPACVDIVKPILKEGAKTIPPEKVTGVTDAYAILEKFLEGHQWVAGDNVTLADLSLITTISSINVLVPIDGGKFPNITAWLKRCQTLPYYSANQGGLDKFTSMIKGLLQA